MNDHKSTNSGLDVRSLQAEYVQYWESNVQASGSLWFSMVVPKAFMQNVAEH